MEHVYMAYNFSLFAIYQPKFIKIDKNLIKGSQNKMHTFFWDSVYSHRELKHATIVLSRFPANTDRFSNSFNVGLSKKLTRKSLPYLILHLKMRYSTHYLPKLKIKLSLRSYTTVTKQC